MALSASIPGLGVIDVYEESINLASVAANTVAEQAFTVSGVGASDYLVGVEVPTGLGVVVGSGFVSAADEVTLVLSNPTASPVDAAAGTFKLYVARS